MDKQPVLVPVDGSPLGERAIPYAVAFANATGASLLLIGVREALSTHKCVGQHLAEQMAQAEEEFYDHYLTTSKEKLSAEVSQVETKLRAGTPADEILRVIEQRAPALLVMSTHGRSGLNRWRYGSVASRLVREAPVATLVLGPKCSSCPHNRQHFGTFSFP